MKILRSLKGLSYIWKNLSALIIAMKKPETPHLSRLLVILAIAYALSPVDLIPDFIPFLGQIDDLILVPLLIHLAIRAIPEDIFLECKAEAGRVQTGKPVKKWYFAIPVLLAWLVLAVIVIRVLVTRL